MIVELGKLMIFVRQIFSSFFHLKLAREKTEIIKQMFHLGVKSQSVIMITGAFTGMVLCAQTYLQFEKLKMESASMAVVGVAMCTELGPVLTALMMAGRVGASITAHLGTMNANHQIDALRTLGTHPFDYLVAPRVVATMAVSPILVAESISLGIIAGFVAGSAILGMNFFYAYYNMIRYTHMGHVLIGFIKSVFFGALISSISCYKGMHCEKSAEGVGISTTESVVTASIAILISNFFLTLCLKNLVNVF